MSSFRLSCRMRRSALLATVAIAASTVALSVPAPVGAVDIAADVLISEVYGGGGNSGATFTNDFVELVNRGNEAVDITGWSVQYASSAGTSWQTTTLTGTIAPDGHFLVQEAAGAGGTTALPTPDGTGSIAMSATSGKVALVANATSLTTLACADACSDATGVVDFVGYGAANDAAGSPTSTLSNTTSAHRVLVPAVVNTGNNATDFFVDAPEPVSSGGTGPTDPCAVTPLPPACIPGFYTIQDVQGTGFVSPLAGTNVTAVAGIVTAVNDVGSGRGFWMEQPTPDPLRPAASSGIFVFTGSTAVPAAAVVGNAVTVTGAVSEFNPAGSEPSALTVTEITPSAVVVESSGNELPDPLVLGPTTVPSTYAPTVPGGDLHTIDPVIPTRSVLELYEAHEGMRVQVDDARIIGPRNAFGEMFVTSKPDELRTPRGGAYIADYDEVPTGKLLMSTIAPAAPLPPANVGDELLGSTSGPLTWSQFGGYKMIASQVGTYVDNGLTGTVAAPAAPDQLSVATYNVENLAPADPQAKYDRLAAAVVANLASPDIIAVEEVQDNSGATNDGVVAADQTLTNLTAAITAAGGPTYQWASIDPVNGADGGQPGGNIRVVLLYNPARVTFVSRPGGDATTPVAVSTGADRTAELSVSPGRVDPTNTAWNASRKPLAGEFLFDGRKVIVVANHFNSKGGDQNADGRFQPPTRSTEVQRTQQALSLNAFVHQVLAADPYANIVLAGDFNDYQFSGPMKALTDDGATLTDLLLTLPPQERYTYVFNGTSQVLDHIVVSKPILDVEYEVIHINAEFSDQASDHDPQVARIRPAAPPDLQGTIALTPTSVVRGGSVSVALAGWDAGIALQIALDATTLTTVTTDASGAATVSIVIPTSTTAGSHSVSATTPDGTSTAAPLTVTAPPPPSRRGIVVTSLIVRAGDRALVALIGWSPRTDLTITLDGTTTLTTVRTDRFGNALVSVTIPRTTAPGLHRVVATATDGVTNAAPLLVLRR